MLASGTLCVAFNNLRGDKRRFPLSLALSEDGGRSWPWVRDLEPARLSGAALASKTQRAEYR
jgi:hypothetical protein